MIYEPAAHSTEKAEAAQDNNIHSVPDLIKDASPLRKKKKKKVVVNSMSEKNEHISDEDEDAAKGSTKTTGKSRRELPAGAVATLKAWLLSPEHFTHPYPTPQDQIMLMQKTGIDKKQLKNWFTNARRRIWKPMLKKQLEQGKLAATGAGGGGVAVPGVVPGFMVPQITPGTDLSTPAPENPHTVQAMHVHYQQAVQQQQQQQPPQQTQPQQTQQPQQQQPQPQYGNAVYVPQQNESLVHPGASSTPAPAPSAPNYGSQQYFVQPQQYSHQAQAPVPMQASSSMGVMPQVTTSSSTQPPPAMNKTDSHAVLMELFARDQDLVRQATESAKMKAAAKAPDGQQASPPKTGSQSRLVHVPTLNSWPHFSSISSLNNLGTMTGVKSITSMSGADLASQGNLNKMGNLAQVKSMESMGKSDSYAFLEVFFGDRSMNMSSSLSTTNKEQRGIKREREEDNDVGLSLDEDAPSSSNLTISSVPAPPPPFPNKEKESVPNTGTLKRAYDDALAARGLISVSRSSEKLTDLALPAKMQKTLSQEYLRQHQAQAQAVQTQQAQQQAPQQQPSQQQQPQAQQQQQKQAPQQYGQYSYSSSAPAAEQSSAPSSQQYPGQHPGQHSQAPAPSPSFSSPAMTDPSTASAEVQVPATSICAICRGTGVDTQLRPCGHMFHERCLKPSLQNPAGQPKCPIDNIPIQSALLAVPTDEANTQQQEGWSSSSSTQYQAPAPAPAIPTVVESSASNA